MVTLARTFLSALLVAALTIAAYDPNNEYNDIFQAFPQFADARERRPYPRVGQQNFTWCCIRALYESFTIDLATHRVVTTTTPFIRVENALGLSTSKWPCGGVSYDEDDRAAPIVEVPFAWCEENCGGWQKSVNSDLSQWIHPFVGFILPAAVFCLSVPRKKTFIISDELFQHDLVKGLRERWQKFVASLHYRRRSSSAGRPTNAKKKGLVNYILEIIGSIAKFLGEGFLLLVYMAIRAAAAAAIALLNTVVWVAIVFAAAAPIVFSALYEAKVDRQVLKTIRRTVGPKPDDPDPHGWLRERKEHKKIVHLLYAVLLGNMLMEDDEGGSELSKSSDEEAPKPPSIHGSIASATPPVYKMYSAVEKLVEPFDGPTSPYTLEVTSNRLQSLLATQLSFGVTIGAPIVFFLGSFLVSIFDNAGSWGDNNTSHALAFGEWWMTIPNVAIMSGCLIAANNPTTFESIMSSLSDTVDHGNVKSTWFQRVFGWWSAFYKSPYQPVWMWERGRNKKKWIRHITKPTQPTKPDSPIARARVFYRADTNASLGTITGVKQWSMFGKTYKFSMNRVVDDEKEKYTWKIRFNSAIYKLRAPGWFVELFDPGSMLNAGRRVDDDNLRLPDVDLVDWAFILAIGSALIFIPFVLAYLTSYNTPTVGLSCRSFTYVLYFLFQLWLSILWLWDFRHAEHLDFLRDTKWKAPWNKRPTLFCLATGFGIIGAFFTAVVGTFLQILGVYRNCLCKIPMAHWSRHDALVVLSTNSAESIHLAMYYWMSTGVAAVVLLILAAYSGWWYQRHWRAEFRSIIEEVFKDPARVPPPPSQVELVAREKPSDAITAEKNAAGEPLQKNKKAEAEATSDVSADPGTAKSETSTSGPRREEPAEENKGGTQKPALDIDEITAAPR